MLLSLAEVWWSWGIRSFDRWVAMRPSKQGSTVPSNASGGTGLEQRVPTLRSPSSWIRSPATSVLSPREQEVAALITYGLTNREIAAELAISEGTVAVHVHHILAKLGIRSRAQVAAWAVEHKVAQALIQRAALRPASSRRRPRRR